MRHDQRCEATQPESNSGEPITGEVKSERGTSKSRPFLWHATDRRALGSHSCGALSSRRRDKRYRRADTASSGKSSVASEIQINGR